MSGFRWGSVLLAGVRTPALPVSSAVLWHPARTPSRHYVAATFVCRAATLREGNATTDTTEAAESEPGAYASIGQRLFSLQQYHAQISKRRFDDFERLQPIQQEAWELLQSIPDAEADRLSTRNLAEIVNAYNYFSDFWENGVEGPANRSSSGGDGQMHGALHDAEGNGPRKASLEYPLVERADANGTNGDNLVGVTKIQPLPGYGETAPPKRANPLDEILDF
jgi:hypothetical protein